jgi:hypothetical protein
MIVLWIVVAAGSVPTAIKFRCGSVGASGASVKEAWNSRPNGSEFDEIMMAAEGLAIKWNLGFRFLIRME